MLKIYWVPLAEQQKFLNKSVYYSNPEMKTLLLTQRPVCVYVSLLPLFFFSEQKGMHNMLFFFYTPHNMLPLSLLIHWMTSINICIEGFSVHMLFNQGIPRMLSLFAFVPFNILNLYHFDSIFLIPVTVFPTRFPHRNSEKRHYETNIIPYFATFENSWEKLIIRANFWVIRGLTASHDPKICTHCECFPHSFSRGRAVGKW